MKIKKILIVGLGGMGRSHLKSFLDSNKKYEIDLVDKKKITIKDKIPNKKKFKINFLKKIPPKKKYDLSILSTNSKERFKLVKYLLEKSKTDFLILEKFLFNKRIDYYNFDKILANKKVYNLFVNSWGEYVFRKLKIKTKNKITCYFYLREGKVLTNLIHILDLFYHLSSRSKITINGKDIKVIESKRKNYNEIIGNLELKASNCKMKIISTKKIKHNTLKVKIQNNIFKLILNNENKCYLYKNKILIKKFSFPSASKTTEKMFLRSIKTNKSKINFNNYEKIKNLSILMIDFFRKEKKFTKLNIT